ncbi:AraC family transcriptional regulator [Chitinophaga silvisoli]|uniref:Helix-turn-helix domain-containing protein n=1 Tax=Chitinophaga silvisoli TaxID=2291814 RepID=A0A3E1NX71_9BACT|nr:helix-turn-helix transcriptional regulator [Chitinophaga silvisoli]RFM32520.1 helix-turn-helix domain-containing protein [Chitinophaga silvisoli]
MNTLPVPVYTLEQDEFMSNGQFKVYHFEGDFPDRSELLIPHRKDHYLIAFIRKAGSRQWIDMNSFELKEHTVYFFGPHQVIVKEEIKQLWSTGIAFTKEFLSLHGNSALLQLPLIVNPYNGYALELTATDIIFIEELLQKIIAEYRQKGDWQQRMLSAYLTVLLTYLSRLYTAQYKGDELSNEQQLLKRFQAKIDEFYQQYHEVNDYASMLNISAGHLSDVIKSQSGKPAIKHIHDRLIMEARRLLFHTDHPLKDISFHLGFSDTSYFNRFFKRETGLTPAAYRDQTRAIYP